MNRINMAKASVGNLSKLITQNQLIIIYPELSDLLSELTTTVVNYEHLIVDLQGLAMVLKGKAESEYLDNSAKQAYEEMLRMLLRKLEDLE